MIPASSREHASWFVQDLTGRILPLWLERSPRENGFFHSQFDREWKPTDEAVGTLVSQTRSIFTMSTGYALTGGEGYREAAVRGIEFLEAHFRDTELSGYFWSCAPDGTVTDDSKKSYGHSFVIFCLAEAARNLKVPEYAARAAEVWNEYRKGFGHKDGGFYNAMSRSFEPDGQPLSQNPIMHLFESLVSLATVPGHERVIEDATRIADFIIGELVDVKTGLLPEFYNASWKPIRESAGNNVDVGHAFEWAFLLSSAIEHGAPKRLLSYAHQFLDSGLTVGFDRDRGLVFSPASLDGERVERTNSYWEQCEALRSLLHFATFRDRRELYSDFDVLSEFVRKHYVDDEFGGWYTSVTPKGTPSRTEKGQVWKLDYHQTTMTLELKRIIDRTE